MVTRKDLEAALEHGITRIIVERKLARLPKTMTGELTYINLSWWFPGKLVVDDNGVLAELSFDGVPFECFFPWESILKVNATQELPQKPKLEIVQ